MDRKLELTEEYNRNFPLKSREYAEQLCERFKEAWGIPQNGTTLTVKTCEDGFELYQDLP